MGDRGDRAHGQWSPWAMGTFWPITSLLLDGFLQKFSHIQLKPPQPAEGYFWVVYKPLYVRVRPKVCKVLNYLSFMRVFLD